MMENNGKDDEDIYVQVETETSNHVTSRKFRVTHRKIHYDVAIRRDDVTSGIKEVVHMITGILIFHISFPYFLRLCSKLRGFYLGACEMVFYLWLLTK